MVAAARDEGEPVIEAVNHSAGNAGAQGTQTPSEKADAGQERRERSTFARARARLAPGDLPSVGDPWMRRPLIEHPDA